MFNMLIFCVPFLSVRRMQYHAASSTKGLVELRTVFFPHTHHLSWCLQTAYLCTGMLQMNFTPRPKDDMFKQSLFGTKLWVFQLQLFNLPPLCVFMPEHLDFSHTGNFFLHSAWSRYVVICSLCQYEDRWYCGLINPLVNWERSSCNHLQWWRRTAPAWT